MKFSALFTHSVRSVVAAAVLTAQILPASDLRGGSTATAGLDLLIQKARSLEARDREDLAAQVWQQVLVTNPNQPDALAALARWAKRNGRNEEANAYLSKLRVVAPDAAVLTQPEALDAPHPGDSRLNEAGRLAAAQHYDEAMRIYREVFGSTPTPGGWAIAYYETLANTSGGFEPAVAALKRLAETYPNVAEYRVAEGRLMTYRPAMRLAGVSVLASVHGSTASEAKARQAWRQALLWEKANPAFVASFNAYLSRYNDTELAIIATNLRAESGKVRLGSPASKEEQLGYKALSSGNVSEAEREFNAALSKDKDSSHARAGLGFADMKAGNFESAVQQLEAAQRMAPNDAKVRESLQSAKFWQAMQRGSKAADEQNWTVAVNHYREAVALRPNDAEAARALGGSLLAAGESQKAIAYLMQAVHKEPSLDAAWCALVQARLSTEGGAAALKTIQSVPPSATAKLQGNVQWMALQATAYMETGNDATAHTLYRDIISSEHPQMTADSQIQVASLALRMNDPATAVRYAQTAVDAAPNKAGGWEVLVAALVTSGKSQEAQRTFNRMPESVQQAVLNHPEFQNTLASLKESIGDLEGARTAIEKQLSAPETAANERTRTELRIHLAQVLGKLGRAGEAETLLDAITDEHPKDLNVWRAHVLFLQAQHRQRDIVALADRMPPDVALRLGNEGDMVNVLAGAHAASGDPAFGVKLLETYLAHTADPAKAIPQRIQLGWVLLETPNESGELYQVLEQLNSRSDLNAEQRKEVSDLWSTWILRTADSARKAGNKERALALLEQGARMFPANPGVQSAFAGNLLSAGDSKRAFNVYANWGLAGAQPDDYAGAIGAALTENKGQYADGWINRGLSQWPTNPKLLTLAGDRAKAHGDLKKAEALWKEAYSQQLAQGSAPAVAGGQTSGSSLRDLLVGNDPTQPQTESAAALLTNDGTPTVRLSSFTPDAGTREDFVRAANVPGVAALPPAVASALTSNGLVSAQPPAEDSLPDKIAALESRNSPYLDSNMSVWGRGGQSGFSKLLIEQSQFGASTTIANTVRASLLLEPTFLSTGSADGSGTALYGRQTAPAGFAGQNAGGLAAETQVSSQIFGLRFGMTPEGFLTQNWVGGLRVQPANGPITLLVERDSVKDTMLSYAGSRDPKSEQTWGGVMSNSAALQGHWGDSKSGFYATAGYAVLQGRQVESNTAISGNVGSWWKVATLPTGSLTVGTNFSAMHYAHNLSYFTFGQGGYFSPQQYFLFNVPVRWNGTYGRRLQYTIGGGLGLQHFVQDESEYYPTDAALQAMSGNMYPELGSTGVNFNFDARLAYQMAPHWMLGAFATASNARNYTAGSAGLFVKYIFEERPMSLDNPVPSIPDWRGQQPFSLF